jgi:hypothetical protein
MRGLAAVSIVILTSSFPAAQSDKARAQAIAAALLPLPVPLREAAAVVELDVNGAPTPLRPGSNALVCIADTPGDDTFDVRCYHRDFISVVYRSFQLGDDGVSGPRATPTIERELKEGRLTMTTAPTFGYRMLGPIGAFNAATSSAGPGIRSWQSVHLPFANTRDLGVVELRQIPQDQRATTPTPFTMASGTYWSHVMIMHPDGVHLGH